MDTLVITVESVLKKLGDLEISKSCGPDSLHPRVLKENNDVLSTALASTVQQLTQADGGTKPMEAC